jgi:hypothetical protein
MESESVSGVTLVAAGTLLLLPAAVPGTAGSACSSRCRRRSR